jgi:catechol 2,3-dioxygenase-like lactoylglutathione lyase family enzyme
VSLTVEHTDFISVPVTDMERSKTFYRETLGLQPVDERGFPEYQLGDNISVYLLDLSEIGSEFTAPHTAAIALRVPDVAGARAALEAKGIEFAGETLDTGVCHMASFADPDGNVLMLHRRYAPRD